MGKDEEDSAAAANNEDQEKSTSAPVSVAERMAKLKQLHQRRQEARKLNHAEVVEEDRRNKMPANAEAKKRRQDWELQDMEARKAAEAAGEDYDRVKMLALQADTAEKIDAAKRRKRNPDPGFIDFEAASLRQYQRLTKQGKPDMQHYKEQKDKIIIMISHFCTTLILLLLISCFTSKTNAQNAAVKKCTQEDSRSEPCDSPIPIWIFKLIANETVVENLKEIDIRMKIKLLSVYYQVLHLLTYTGWGLPSVLSKPMIYMDTLVNISEFPELQVSIRTIVRPFHKKVFHTIVAEDHYRKQKVTYKFNEVTDKPGVHSFKRVRAKPKPIADKDVLRPVCVTLHSASNPNQTKVSSGCVYLTKSDRQNSCKMTKKGHSVLASFCNPRRSPTFCAVQDSSSGQEICNKRVQSEIEDYRGYYLQKILDRINASLTTTEISTTTTLTTTFITENTMTTNHTQPSHKTNSTSAKLELTDRTTSLAANLEGDSKQSTLIVIIVILSILLLLCLATIIILAVFWRKEKKKRIGEQNTKTEQPDEDLSSFYPSCEQSTIKDDQTSAFSLATHIRERNAQQKAQKDQTITKLDSSTQKSDEPKTEKVFMKSD